MAARNETRGRRWARRLLVVCLAAVVVQVLGWLLVDGVGEAVLVLAPWPLVTVGMVLTSPVGRPGLPVPQPSPAQQFAPAFPSVVFFVPMAWLGRQQDGGWLSWSVVGMGLLCTVALGALVFRARRVRRGPVPLVPLRRTDEAAWGRVALRGGPVGLPRPVRSGREAEVASDGLVGLGGVPAAGQVRARCRSEG